MERIKQALDKARAEHNSEKRDRNAPADTDKGAASTISKKSIEYSQTRVVALDATVLQQNRVIYSDSDKSGLAAYKMLRTQVLQRMTARGWNSLAITSPSSADGKTLTSINLAISLARELHHTVLLVDMDLRNPSVHRYIGLEPEYGIADHLVDGAPLEEVMVNPGIQRLVILPGRAPVENSSEVLSSPTTGVLVRQLKERYPSRMIIFDLPPVLTADDALSFSPYVDAFLLVVRDGETQKMALEQSLDIMKEATILGTVLNDAEDHNSSYY